MSFPPETPNEARRHELLADVAEQIAQRLIEQHGMAEEAAADVGNALADFLASHWKGQSIYMPGDQAFKLNERDWRIFNDFQRGNANDLARQHDISKVRVHQIYKRCITEWRARMQHDLFGAPDASQEAASDA